VRTGFEQEWWWSPHLGAANFGPPEFSLQHEKAVVADFNWQFVLAVAPKATQSVFTKKLESKNYGNLLAVCLLTGSQHETRFSNDCCVIRHFSFL
jgi:hypothetical protein